MNSASPLDTLAAGLMDLWSAWSGSTLVLCDQAGQAVGWTTGIREHQTLVNAEGGLLLIDQLGFVPEPCATPMARALASGAPVLDEVWLFQAVEGRRVVFVDCWPIPGAGGAVLMLTPPQRWASRSRGAEIKMRPRTSS